MRDDIIILGKGRDAFGNRVISYCYEDEPDLKRITLLKDLKNEANKKK